MVGRFLAVDAAHWWGPAGWLYRNTTGNIAASAIWGPIGLAVGAVWAKHKVVLPIHARLDAHQAHHEAHAEALANIQQQLSSMGGTS